MAWAPGPRVLHGGVKAKLAWIDTSCPIFPALALIAWLRISLWVTSLRV